MVRTHRAHEGWVGPRWPGWGWPPSDAPGGFRGPPFTERIAKTNFLGIWHGSKASFR